MEFGVGRGFWGGFGGTLLIYLKLIFCGSNILVDFWRVKKHFRQEARIL